MERDQEFLKLSDAIEHIEESLLQKCVDVVSLPPNTVDCLTDDENVHLKVDENIIFEKNMPDIPGHV